MQEDHNLPSWFVRFAGIDGYRRVDKKASGWWMYASRIHPRPEFYKYDWWIFWAGAPVDGDELIFNEQYMMSTSDALALRDRLSKMGEVYFLYNRKRPRLDPANPFDPSAERWEGVEWAPPLADDPDPEVTRGSWSGHK